MTVIIVKPTRPQNTIKKFKRNKGKANKNDLLTQILHSLFLVVSQEALS